MQITDINAARQYAAEDFPRFIGYCAHLLGFKPPRHHLVMGDFLQGSKPQWVCKKKVILGFRLAAKSTVAARWYAMWRWLRNPYAQVIIHSSTDDNAKEMARGLLRDMRSNPLLQHLAPPPSSSEIQFNLAGIVPEVGFSLKAAGINTSLVGSRCDLYLFDDPEPDVEPESARSRVMRAFEEAVHILHEPGRHMHKLGMTDLPDPERTQFVVLGQPHCEHTVYVPTHDEIHDEEGGHPLADAAFLKIPVINSTGFWTWPEMMEKKYFSPQLKRAMTVEEVRRGFTTPNWMQQMMIDISPLGGLGSVIKTDKIEILSRQADRNYICIDPADGGNCEWGISIGGPVPGGKIHVCFMGGMVGESYEGDISDETIGESVWRRIFDIADEFKCHRLYLEKNYKAAASACRRYLMKSGRQMRVEEFSAKANKLVRICESLEQPFANGLVTMSPEVLRDKKNYKQLKGLKFDSLPKPVDRLDSLASLISILTSEKATETLNVSQHMTDGIQVGCFERMGQSTSPFERLKR